MKIVVLAGGLSTERDVSLVSGEQVYNAFVENGHEVILLDVYLGYEPIVEEHNNWEHLFKKRTDCIQKNREAGLDITFKDINNYSSNRNNDFFGPNVIKLCQYADIVFMALHGENGENGRIQACFDLFGIKYTGTDYLSSALSMNKSLAKDIFKAFGIPTPIGITMSIDEYNAGKNIQDISYPLIVKACSGGSSIGCAVAHDETEIINALDNAFKYDTEVVIEQFIDAREFTVAVIEGKALPIVEIIPKVGFYDYQNKYQVGSAIEVCPAELDEGTTNAIQNCAIKAFDALRLKKYARLDFLLDKSTNKFYCLEANTLPGMTPTSLLPQEAAAIGMSFNDLCEKIIEMSL